MPELEALRQIYNRFSRLDYGLMRGGMAPDRRRALWAGLADDPLITDIINDRSTSAAMRNTMKADVEEWRRIHEEALIVDSSEPWCADSIYEAMLAIFFLSIDGDEFVFRGHLDADWQLIPSFFRRKPRANLMLHARAVYGAYKWAEREVGASLNLTPFGVEAAAQHYGAGTTLLDVTESLRVAAYFATTPLRSSDKQGQYGTIYCLSVNDLKNMGRGVLRARSLPDALVRIHKTKGAFISGLGYLDDANAKAVRSADDIIEWINKSEQVISELDESGIGIAASFMAGAHPETGIVKFKQTGAQFEDQLWGVSRKQLSD
jgi:hypothetical protein